jgi:hypothetical protein
VAKKHTVGNKDMDLNKINNLNDLLDHLTKFKNSDFPKNMPTKLLIDNVKVYFKYRRSKDTFPIMLQENNELLFIDFMSSTNSIHLTIVKKYYDSNQFTITRIINNSGLTTINSTKKHSKDISFGFQLITCKPNAVEKNKYIAIIKQILQVLKNEITLDNIPIQQTNNNSSINKDIINKKAITVSPVNKNISMPDEHQSFNDIITELTNFNSKQTIIRYQNTELSGKTIKGLAIHTFGNTIARAFHHENPTERYRDWSLCKNPAKIVTHLNKISNQKDFDKFLIYEVAQSLVDEWGTLKNNGKSTYMNIGIALKIVNILFKHLTFSEYITNPAIIQFLHVPWDKYTIAPLKNVWQHKPTIPQKATMSFVSNLEIYYKLHQLITEISKLATCPRIYYELCLWNKSHQ